MGIVSIIRVLLFWDFRAWQTRPAVQRSRLFVTVHGLCKPQRASALVAPVLVISGQRISDSPEASAYGSR